MTDTHMTIAATGQEWIRADEVQAQLAEARREALRELRSKWLVRDLTQSDFIDAEAPAQPKPDAVQEAAKCSECCGSGKEYDSGTCGLLDVRKCWKCDGIGRALAGGDSDE